MSNSLPLKIPHLIIFGIKILKCSYFYYCILINLIIPLDFIPDPRSVRGSVFLDYGNVFSDGCRAYETNCNEFDFSELRYSIGVGVTWITALGPLSFALASVFNDSPADRTETFQFEIGTQF